MRPTRIKTALVALALGLACGGCDNSLEQKLEGKWQLKEVRRPEGLAERVDTVWYNFQTSLFEYQLYVPALDSMRNLYGYKTLLGADSLELELISYFNTTQDFLPLTDWSAPKRLFRIVEQRGDRLVLESDGKEYHFKKQ
mgnify:FL=1